MMAASIPIPAPNLSYLDSDDDYPDLLTDQQYYRMLMEHKIGDWWRSNYLKSSALFIRHVWPH